MASVFTGNVYNLMKDTLNSIIDDKDPEAGMDSLVSKLCEMKTMRDHYEDDLEMAGPGLLSEKDEGVSMDTGDIVEGYKYRYVARTWALKLVISEEVMEDNKYPQAIKAAKRLKRAFAKTRDIDVTLIYARAGNSSYPGGDGVELCSTAHPLPRGGSFSNKASSYAAPSKISVASAVKAIMKQPGHDGITEGYKGMTFVYPVAFWDTFAELMQSKLDPVTDNLGKINVVNSELSYMNRVPNPYLDAFTEANWFIRTNVEGGPNCRMRRQPRNRTWVENSEEMMVYSVSARWSRGWSDARGVYGNIE